MNSLSLAPATLEETFAHLRRCGAGRRECVAYWVAGLDAPDQVIEVVHPEHTASAFGYEVDTEWVTRFFLGLRSDRRTVRAQVHTHPGLAGHSETDDQFALAPSTGFLSLVIPEFGIGPVGLAGAHLVEMDPEGEWRVLRTEEALVIG